MCKEFFVSVKIATGKESSTFMAISKQKTYCMPCTRYALDFGQDYGSKDYPARTLATSRGGRPQLPGGLIALSIVRDGLRSPNRALRVLEQETREEIRGFTSILLRTTLR